MRSLCIALFLAVLLAGCEKTVPELMEQAKTYRAQAENRAAVISFKNVLLQDPGNVEAQLLLGTTFADLGEFPDAEKAFRKSLELGSPPERVLLQLGQVLLQLEKFQALLEDVQAAAPLSMQAQSDIALLRGRAHLRLGETTDARTQFSLALRERPVDARLGLAQSAAAEGDAISADKLMEEILAVAPESAESWVFRGDLLRSEGKSEEALAAYRKAAILQPANVSARKMLAATLLRKEQPQSATYVLEPLLAQPTDDAELLSLAGQAYLQIGQVRKALQFLERAVALDPANARIRTSLGLTRLAGGERRLAVDDLEAAVALKATDTRAENYLIMALVARGETSKALQAAQALEQKQPNKSVTHLLKGAVFLAQQDFVRARASFERSLALQPAYFPAAAALAQIDLREKNAEAARGRMEGVLKHDKKNLDAMLALAKFEFDAGRRSEAVARLRQAQSEHPQALQPVPLVYWTPTSP